MLAAVAAGIVVALVARHPPTLPRVAIVLAQGIFGVTVGSFVGSSTLDTLGAHWLSVIAVCIVTLVLSIVLGLALAAVAPVDRATASLGMIAGGAAGMVSISDDLGADDRLVVVMQYLRVLLIVSLMPVAAAVLFGISEASPGRESPADALVPSLGFAALCLAVGIPIAALARLPAGALVGPMVVSAVLGSVEPSLVHPMPGMLQNAALAAIGLQVGLRFTPASLRATGSLLPVTTLFVLVLIVACAALGLALAAVADVSELDAYLATTPGGMYVVVATAAVGKADAAFVLAVQLLRAFLMLLVAPPLLRLLLGRGAGRAECHVCSASATTSIPGPP
jgi:membrane AbrB-like protein